MGVNTNARGYSYSKTSGSSSFHQDGDHEQDLRKVYSSGAYGPDTDWSKYSSAYTTQKTDTPKPTGSNTGSTTASIDTSGYSGGGGTDYASMLMAQLESQRAAQQAAAENAYRNSMARLNTAWGETTDSLAKNLNSTLGRLDEQYKFNENRAQNDANKSLREAYINYMMNKKNLAQGLSALGLSGGATESNMAKMYNNYGSSRNNINTTLADNIAMLLQDLSNSKSQAEQLYNTQFADARNNYMQQMNALEAALANSIVSTYSGSNLSNIASYANALNNINTNGDFNPTKNTLAVNQVSTTQGNDTGSVTDYAKWKAMADSLAKQGATSDGIIYQLMQNGAGADVVRSLFGY